MRPGAGVLFLAGILLAALAAPWLSPGPPGLQEDVAGGRLLPPLTRAHVLRPDPHRAWIVTDLRRTENGWEFRRAGREGTITPEDLFSPPSRRVYPLGTDALGRDLAGRVLHGARHSLFVASASVLLALLIGLGVGGAAGLAGGWWDAVLMRGVDLFLSLPRVLIFLVCATLFPPSTLLLVLVLGATAWTEVARVVRASAMALRESDLVRAVRAVGSRPARILFRHLIPELAPAITVNLSLRFADMVLLESSLSFLGLGSPPPAVSLGGIVASGREVLTEAWWVVAWPGFVIGILVMALHATGTALHEVTRPAPSPRQAPSRSRQFLTGRGV